MAGWLDGQVRASLPICLRPARCPTCHLPDLPCQCHEDPLDHRRRRGDVLRELFAGQRAGGRAPGARSRGHAPSALHADQPPTRSTSAAIRCCLAGSASTCSSVWRCSGNTPRFLDRWWDSPRVINAFASRSISTDPKLLGDLTISMLEGPRGVLRKEFDKLLDWLADEPVPDVVNLPNSLLIGLARPLARRAEAAGLLHAAGRGSLSRRPARAVSRARDRADSPAGAGRGSLHRGQRLLRPGDVTAARHSRPTAWPSCRSASISPATSAAGPATASFASAISRGSRRRRGCTRSPTPTSASGSGPPGRRVRLEAAGYLSRDARAVSRGGPAQPRPGRPRRRVHLSRRRRPRGQAGIPALARRPVGARDLRRAEGRLSARSDGERRPGRAAAARRVHRGRREDRRRPARRARRSRGAGRRSRTSCGTIDRCGETLGERAFDGVRAHYSIAQSADRMMAVYEAVHTDARARRAGGVARNS